MTTGTEPWNYQIKVVQATENSLPAKDEQIASQDEKSPPPAEEHEPERKDVPTNEPGPATNSKPVRKPFVRVDERTRDGGVTYTQTAKRAAWKISSKYALVVRQVFDAQGDLTETLVDIKSQGLLDALLDIFKDVEGMRLSEKPPVIVHQHLFHAAMGLRQHLDAALTKEPRNSDLVFDLQAALQVIKEDFTSTQENLDSLVASGRITFDTLWAVTPPNELVYSADALGGPRVHRTIRSGLAQKDDGSVVYYVQGRSVDSNGSVLGWTRTEELEIPRFSGEKSISDLPFYPLRFHVECARVRKELVERGRRRIRIQQARSHEYQGPALQETVTSLGMTRIEKFSCHGRIVIDPAAFEEIEPYNSFTPTIRQVVDENDLKEEELLTMPAVVYGFSLTEKLWGAFGISHITDIEWNTSVWDSLVAPDSTKRLVRTLVKSHVSHSAGFDDFVRGKGRGVVGLLSGPPGVGKTLTAEAVAETMQRPLYMISSGELGSNADVIDQRLRKVFRLAQTWKAVLLLDEADVFMARRSTTDLARNAIVSVFLRHLEYYQGILILTTNRLSQIDDAFRSRIHFQLAYSPLDHAARKAIWQGFLASVSGTAGVVVDVDDEAVDKLAEMDMNGRQIKNVVKMAQLFAADENRPLTLDDIVLLAGVSQGSTERHLCALNAQQI